MEHVDWFSSIHGLDVATTSKESYFGGNLKQLWSYDPKKSLGLLAMVTLGDLTVFGSSHGVSSVRMIWRGLFYGFVVVLLGVRWHLSPMPTPVSLARMLTWLYFPPK